MTRNHSDRRDFLTAAMATGGAALALGLSPAAMLAQQTSTAGPRPQKELSFDQLYDTSVLATGLTGEAADRLALRRLVDAWAHYADRRMAEKQADLFVPDGVNMGYEGDPETHQPHSVLKGRDAIRKALAVLNKFSVTLHMNGQSDFILRGERAIGQTYCLAHEFWTENNDRKFQTLGIRYYDQFVRQENRWYILERKLIIDWSDTRISVP